MRVYSDTLSREEHKKLRDVAIGHGGTVNDILSAESFKLFHDWNQSARFVGRIRISHRAADESPRAG